MKLVHIVGFGALTAALGCTTGAPVPADKLARAEAAVRGAEEIGAERNAEGARHLLNARAAYGMGKKLVLAGEQERATMVLLRAEADAELAMNMTREATAFTDARTTRDEVRNLRMSMKGGN